MRQLIIVFIMLLILNRLIFQGPTYAYVSYISSNQQLNPILLRLLCQYVLNGLGGVHLLINVLNNDMIY